MDKKRAIEDFSEAAKFSAVLDIVNDITQADSIESIYLRLKRKVKWVVGSTHFILVLKSLKGYRLYSGTPDEVECVLKSPEEVPFIESLIQWPDLVKSLSGPELMALGDDWRDYRKGIPVHEVFSVKGGDESSSLMIFFNKGPFSRDDGILLRTLANVVMSHANKVDLLFKEKDHKNKLEQSYETLKEAQLKLVEQEELERSEARYKALIDATSTIAWTTNEKGEFVDRQYEWEKYTGQGFDQHKGFGWADALHPSCRDKCVEEWNRVLKTGETLLAEGQLWSESHKSFRYFEVYAAPLKDRAGNIKEWVGNITDTTDRLYHKAKLEETVVELKEAVSARSKFLANISHEIRTPLNSIVGFTDIAKDEQNHDLIHQYLKTIHQTSLSLMNLVNDILDFSKIESGELTLHKETFVLEDLIKEIIDSVSFQVNRDKVKLSMLNGNDSHKKVYFDPTKLKQVILNLVYNSVKFTEEGFIRIETHYEVDKVLIRVKDSGIGIDEASLDKIFREFEQEDITTIKKYKGVGLGLSIVKRLVEFMGGAIKCNSKKDLGATFWVELPCDPNELSLELKTRNKSHKLMSELNVLIVDDSQDNLTLMERYFSKTTCRVDLVNSGDDAVANVYQKEYDVIFMDIMMPVKDGYQTTEEIRTLEKEMGRDPVLIVALSANVHKSSVDKMLASGCDKHLAKPIIRNDLFEFLNSEFQS